MLHRSSSVQNKTKTESYEVGVGAKSKLDSQYENKEMNIENSFLANILCA